MNNDVLLDDDLIQGGGLLGIGESHLDYSLAGSDAALALLTSQEFNRQPTIEYNQGAQYETRNWCTIYSCFTQISYLLNKEFLLSDIQEVGHAMINAGKLDPDKGAYLRDAVDFVRRRYNNKNENKLTSYLIDYKDKELVSLLTHGNAIRLTQIGYRTSTELFKELESKGHASQFFYPHGGGHAVSMYGYNIIDNYAGRKKHNRYSFDNFDELVANNTIMQYGYLFLTV